MTRHGRRDHQHETQHPSYRIARWLGRNWARLSYARKVEPTWLEVNRWDLPIEGLPKAFEGFRIVQLSDLHGGGHMPHDYLAETVARAKVEAGDAIVLTGDFVHKGFHYVEHVAASLTGLSAPHGVFAVLGNHDH